MSLRAPLLSVLLAIAALAASPARSEQPAYKDGEVLIKFKPGASQGEINSVLGALHATRIKHFGRIRVEHERITGMSVEEAVRRFRGHRAVAYIEPNYIVHADLVPDDPSFGDLWGLRNTGQTGGTPGADIHAVEAWNATTGSDILVAMIDTGIDYNHPDLAPNIYVNPGEIPDNGIDDDHNGFVDDVHGWDFANNDNDPFDDAGHGTHTAGTVGAVGNNGLGVAGVCWHAKLMPLKFLSANGFGAISDALSCVEYATMMGARIMSNSWGGGGFSEAFLDAIKDANNAGILFVAAAGNGSLDNDQTPFYPSSYDAPNVISVAATTASDDKASFSNFGETTVDLGAPGVHVLSTTPYNTYAYHSGTSMAAPHVAGALALILSRFPTLTADHAKRLLLESTDPVPALRGVVATGGRLNVARALQGPDSIPPARVADLRALAIASNKIRLDWTATGNDGTDGSAVSYDLRYATFPIDAGNFDTATRYPATLNPSPSGVHQTMVVGGLAASTTYYLALKASDGYANTSPVSNTASATTLIPPEIDVTPTALSAALSSGGPETRTITIRNLTLGTLDFDVEAVPASPAGAAGTSGPAAAAAAATGTATAPLPALPWSDYVRAASSARATDVPSAAIATAPADLPVVITDPAQDSALVDLTVVRASSDHTSLNVEMEFHTAIDRLAFGGFLFLDADQNRATGVLPPYGNGLQDIGAEFEIQFFTLGSGVVSVYHAPTRTFIVSVPVAIGTNTLSFSVPLFYLGDDEGSMDVSGVVGDVGGPTDWFPDSGHGSIAGVRWVTVVPSVGSVPPGGSVDLLATLDARGLKEGAYDATLRIASNDPDEPVVPVSAHLDVSGTPSINLPSSEMAFGPVPVGTSRSDSIVVSNVGTSRLDVQATSDTPAFVTDTGPFSLAPGASRAIVVTFTPGAIGPVSGTLLIDNNDPDAGPLFAYLSGSGIVPANIAITSSPLQAALITGQTSTQALSIQNSGGSDLAITISVQNPALSLSLPSPSAPNPDPAAAARDVTSLAAADNSAIADSGAASAFIPVLVIQETNAWGVAMSPLLEARFGIKPTVIRSDQIPTTDFSHYDLIITVGDEVPAYYANLSLYRDKFEEYVNRGGVVQYQIASYPGEIHLPGRARYIFGNYEFQNRVVAPSHPIVAGLPWVLDGFYANHGYLTNLPAGAQVLTETSISRVPTTVVYSLGLGTVVATGMTWEFLYNFGYPTGPILTQAIAYSLSRIVPRWVRTNPTGAVVPAGGSLGAEVTFDATWVRGGPHDAVIRIQSNDPDRLEVLLPAHLDVTPRPEIELSRTALSFGSQFVGGATYDSIVVSNLGTGDLVVSEVGSGIVDFTAEPTSCRIAPLETQTMRVAFRPSREGAIPGMLVIRSNDEDEGELRVALSGTGLPAPAASVAPGAFHFMLPPGGRGSQPMLLRNAGGSPLTYTVEARGSGAATAAATAVRQATSLPKGAPDPRVGDPVQLGVGGPDQFGHTWLDSDQAGGPAFHWIEISGTGTRIPIIGDDLTSQAVPIGFPFSFYGNTFTLFRVCSNGFLSFTSHADDYTNQPIPSAGSPENLISAFWDDLFIPYDGGMYTQGDSTRMVVEFQNVFQIVSGSREVPYTFEMILDKSGAILFQYLSMQGDVTSATIGVQNGTRDDGLSVAFNTPYAHGNLAVLIGAGPGWVRSNPGNGTIAPGGEQSLDAVVDASGLVPGAYFSTLRMYTNDPIAPILAVPVTLRVLSQVDAVITQVDPGTLNGASKGRQIQARVELPPGVDPSRVLLSSVRFQGAVPSDQKTLRIGDFNQNGIPDLLFQFDRGAVAAILPSGSRVPVTVTGEIEDIAFFTGRDTMRVIQPHLNSPNGGESLVSGSQVPITWVNPAGWSVDHADLSLSSDDGATWAPLAQSVGGQSFAWTVGSVASASARVRVDLYDGEGLIGTDSSDRAFGIGTWVAAAAALVPSAHALYQNSPNPFNPSTEIRFDIPVSSPVRLRVYGADGRVVRTLLDRSMPAGRHRVTWDGTDERGGAVATGVYYYRIAAGAFQASRKLVMVK